MSANTRAGATAGHRSAARARRVGRSLVRQARRSSAGVVDYYEYSGGAVADFEARIAATTIEPAASIGAAYADLHRELIHAQVAAVRVLMKL